MHCGVKWRKVAFRVASLNMFRGVSHITMDAKGRFALPARQRERLQALCGGQIVATVDTHSKCLRLYPMPAWEALEEKLQALPSMNKLVRGMQRLILGYACELEFDANGRALLSQSLRDYAVLEKKLVLVGLGSKFELWSEEQWSEEEKVSLEAVQNEEEFPDELKAIAF